MEQTSSYMNAVLAVRPAYNERAALKLVEGPLAQLKAAPAEDRAAFVFEALGKLPDAGSFTLMFALKGMVSALLRGGVPLSSTEAVRLVESVCGQRQDFPYKAVLTALEKQPRTPALAESLLRLRSMIDHWHGERAMQELHERIDTLVHGPAPKENATVPASAWTSHVFSEIDASPQQLAWRALFLHARSLTQSNASRKWLDEGVAMVDRIGRAGFLEASQRWLALGPMPGKPGVLMPEDEAGYQKGFLWILGGLGDTSIAPAIAGFAVACFRKIPMLGAVSHRVGNACVNALSAMPGMDAVSQLSRLAVRVKYDVARRLIEKALAEAAARNNVSRDDLEAMSVPVLDIDPESIRIEDSQAMLAAKRGAPAELKKKVKELNLLLATQRLRIERMPLSEGAGCAFNEWKQWYIDHPVTSIVAANLIWEVGGTTTAATTAIWRNGGLVDWTGSAVTPAPDTRIRLWHPIRSNVQTVLSWRCWLEDNGVCQPFKQAHREVYLLTAAELETATFSQRFAAHIVRQHQFAALCRERGWKFTLMGQWDSHNTPELHLKPHGLRVQLDVDFAATDETTAHAVYLLISTGQLRFCRLEQEEPAWPRPMPLTEVPPVIFSEVMRDVDLFVGVSSIGADPRWGAGRQDTEDLHAAYWREAAFGELSTAAETRRSVIQSLLPKLAIKDRCRVDGRFLSVRGDSGREYRIHMGSANAIMEPGSRYLCIVAGPGDNASGVRLPFEGDRVLATILSKALLLARDTAIKDPTIRQQLDRN